MFKAQTLTVEREHQDITTYLQTDLTVQVEMKEAVGKLLLKIDEYA
jgi:hypothetical protein